MKWLILLGVSLLVGLYADWSVRNDSSGLAPPYLPVIHFLFPALAVFVLGTIWIMWRKWRRKG